MRIHRFANIGILHTVNIDLITHFWSLRPPSGHNEIKIHSIGGVYLGVYEADGTSEYEDAKKLRDQLVGGWHDHNFVQLGPSLSVNPVHITGFQNTPGRVCILIANNFTIGRSVNDSGYSELVKLRDFLVTGIRDGGANDGS